MALQNYLLELEGKAVGRLFGTSGGSIRADVIETGGGSATRHKHIGSVSYEDIELRCGTGMSRVFYDWVGNSFSNHLRKNGAVVELDNSGKPKSRLEFYDALVNSLKLPALNHSANEAAVMTVGLSPEIIRLSDLEKSQKPGVYAGALPKAWNISDFHLSIDGLENDCGHITQVDAVSMGKKIMQNETGEVRINEKEPTGTSYSDLVVKISSTYSKGFQKWFTDFVVNGNNRPDNEKKGVLEYFAPKSKQAYFKIELKGLGIYKFGSERGQPAAGIYTIAMYCEEMKFVAGSAAVI